jgi:N6-L-threonylcarbamoyladenine synthase
MPPYQRILALESSCDDTAVAIVENGRHVLANVVCSQTSLHAQFGGVVPEAAAREHIESINATLQAALDEAGCNIHEIDAFAATLGPGLVGSLLVGANTGKTLSLITGKPFLGVHHLYAHVASNYLESDLEPPFLCLLVSGGHTQLIVVDDYATMRVVGESLDDAVGEAYDKVARLMKLPYPGGPVMDKLATQGNPHAFPLPKANTNGIYDFSFSGLKTASLRAYEKALALLGPDAMPEAIVKLQTDMAASFQHTVVGTLFQKTVRCARDLGIKTLTVAGGVSANQGLRQKFQTFVEENPDYRLFVPQMSFCTDNAAMVAASAYFNPYTTDIRQEVFSRGAI